MLLRALANDDVRFNVDVTREAVLVMVSVRESGTPRRVGEDGVKGVKGGTDCNDVTRDREL